MPAASLPSAQTSSPQAGPPTKALIKVGYSCNDHCSFCHTLDVRHIDGPAEEVHRKIERAKVLGHRMVVLSGGEPTIRPELTRWAAHVARLGMDFGLVTNGRMLSYPKVVEALLRHRLRYVYLSLHGGSAKVHNAMVRSDAFDETFGALARLTGHGIDLHVNCVVAKGNVDHLRELVDAVLPYPDLTCKFSMIEPKGGGNRLFNHLMPRVGYVAERVADAIVYGEAKVAEAGAGPRFAHGAIPLCLLPGLEDRFDDLKTHRFLTMVEVGEADFFPVDDENKLQPADTCAGCPLSGPCPGLYRGYHETFGAAELRPAHARARSNSYNYVFERVAFSDTEPCPIARDGVTPWDRGRHLFVRHERKIVLYRADSRDFSDAEMQEVKRRGQLYVDISQKNAPDDFRVDLRKLVRSAQCTGCPEYDRCTGLHEVLPADVFSRDDQRVKDYVAGLTGRVLDLGAGHGPYLEALAEPASQGALELTLVEPDAESAALLRKRAPFASVVEASAEELSSPGEFDHVLILRSWNHLRDPLKVVRAIRGLLASDGTLSVVDNVAFGLARSRRQASRGEGSTSALEHYRNDAAEDADRLLSGLGFELLERHDVGPETSNQWFLRYRCKK
ncbi:MAG: radical SAM protein [Myxococcota bacterium]